MTKVKLIEQLRGLSEWFFLAAFATLPFAKAALETFLLLSFICWIALKILKPESPSRHRLLIILSVLLIISSSVSIYDCGYLSAALRGVIKLVKYLLVLMVAQDLFSDPGRLKHLLIVGVVVVSVVIFDAIYQQLFSYDLIRQFKAKETSTQIRLTGPFNQYGLLAAFLIAVLPVLAGSLFSVGPTQTLKWMGLCILTGFVCYLLYRTQSRGAWIASFLSVVLFAMLVRKKWLLVLLAACLILAPFLLPRNAIIHLDSEGKEQSVLERFALWDRAIDVIKARPLFGCGINTYVKNYPKFDQNKSWRVPGYYAHNGYLQLAAETGLISLALFLTLIGLSLKSGYAAYRSTTNNRTLIAGFFAGSIALLLQACFDTTLHNLQSAVLIWFYLGLLFAFGQIMQPKKAGAS